MMCPDAEDGERRWLGRSDQLAHRYGLKVLLKPHIDLPRSEAGSQ